MKILGERLKQLREENGFTQGKLAELLGLPQSSIARYESEVSSPAPETLLKYADTFDVSLDFLFGRTDKPQGRLFRYQPKFDSEVQRVAELLFEPGTRLNRELKQSVLRILAEENAPYSAGKGNKQ